MKYSPTNLSIEEIIHLEKQGLMQISEAEALECLKIQAEQMVGNSALSNITLDVNQCYESLVKAYRECRENGHPPS